MTDVERLEKAQKKRYRIYEYVYSRYNSQNGTHEYTSDIIASSDSEAKKIAEHNCNSTVYGSNTFLRLSAKSDILAKEDYTLEVKDWGKDNYHVKPIVEAKRNYSSKNYDEAMKNMKTISQEIL
jgi:hypothetical protein